jgi:hypothetical protein
MIQKTQEWEIQINSPFLGLCPAFWTTDYPSYGNKNQAGKLQNIDLSNPSFITQGSGLSSLTNGTQAGAVTTLIKGILDYAQASDVSFCIGGTKLYKISSTAVTNDGTFPRSVTNMTDGQDVAYYGGNIYYSFNKASGGDMGQLTLPSTFDDDWLSTSPTGYFSLQGSVPHPLLSAGNDFLYIGNKNYLSSYDGTNATEKDLDLPSDCVIQDLAWAQNRIWAAANRPNISGENKNIASIYAYDGNSPSWEDEITVMGRIGALFVRNGIVFVFYEDITSTGGYKLGYISGTSIVDVAQFTGSLPSFYQVTEYKNLIIWVSGSLIWAWGSIDKDVPVSLSQIADGGYSTIGGIACPFGTPIVASNETTSYKLAVFSGYDTACYWYSLLFDATHNARKSIIQKIKFTFEKLATGARMDYTIKNNAGTTFKTGTISFASDGAITNKDFFPQCEVDNFRIELSWANGSATNPVSVRSIKIYGHTII